MTGDRPHFPCLDAYRGIGMTMVLCNHAAYSTGFIQQSALGPIVARFDLSVPMFFVISGFLLFRPYARAILTDRPLGGAGRFYRRRAQRILPSYWLALAGIGALLGLAIPTLRDWIGNILLLPAFGVPVQVCSGATCHQAYGITQAWSIGVEATFYLLLPPFAALLARTLARRPAPSRRAGLLLACAGLYGVGAGFRIAVVAAAPPWARTSLLWLPMFLDLFAVGMALAVISAAPAELGGRLRRAAERAADHPALCWLAAGVLFAVMTRFAPPAEPFGLNGREYVPRQFVYGIASAAWLLPAMFGDQAAGRLRRVLASRPLVHLGAVSLSFYLWHLALVEQVKAWTVPDYAALRAAAANPQPGNPLGGLETFTGNFWLVAGLTWLLSLAVATVLHRTVELPGMRFGERAHP